LLRTNKTLQVLVIGKNKLSDIGTTTISKALKINNTLKELDLVQNDIGYEGAQSISQALKVNSTLTLLHLALNDIKDNGTTSIYEAIKHNNRNSIGQLLTSIIKNSYVDDRKECRENGTKGNYKTITSKNHPEEVQNLFDYNKKVDLKDIKRKGFSMLIVLDVC